MSGMYRTVGNNLVQLSEYFNQIYSIFRIQFIFLHLFEFELYVLSKHHQMALNANNLILHFTFLHAAEFEADGK